MANLQDLFRPPSEGGYQAPPREEKQKGFPSWERSIIARGLEIPETMFKGLVAGVAKDPILNAIAPPMLGMKGIAWALGYESAPEMGEALQQSMEGKTFSDVSTVVGEVLPGFAMGMGLMALGRAAAVKTLSAAAPKLQQLEAVHKREKLAKGLRHIQERRKLNAGMAPILDKPGVERAAEVVGGATGLAAHSATDEGLRSGDAGKALVAGAVAAGLGAGTELGAIGLAKFLRARPGKLEGPKDYTNVIDTSPGRLRILAEIDDAHGRALKSASDEIKEAFGALEVQQSLLDDVALGKLGGTAIDDSKRGYHFAKRTYDDAVRKKLSLEEQHKAFQALSNEEILYLNYGTLGRNLAHLEPDGKAEFLGKIFMQAIETPEAFLSKTGPTGMRFLQKVAEAETEFVVSRSASSGFVQKFIKEAAEAMNESRPGSVASPTVLNRTKNLLGRGKQHSGDGRFLAPVVEAWELGGYAAVEARFGQSMANVFQKNMQAIGKRYEEAASIGALRPMDAATKERFGVKEFWPHHLEAQSTASIKQRLTDVFKRKHKDEFEWEARSRAERAMEIPDGYRTGMGPFPHQEFVRLGKGSLQKNIDDGIPFEQDPFIGLEAYLHNIDQSVSYGKRFGYGETVERTIDNVVRMAEQEGASAAMMRTMASSLLGYKVYPMAMRKGVQAVTSLEVATKLPLAVVFNSTQSMNTGIVNGMRNTLKGIRDVVKKEDIGHLQAALALDESIFQGVRRSWAGQNVGEMIPDKFADWVLRSSGFSAVERFNRLVAGRAAEYMIRDTMAKGLAGRLRGNAMDIARRRFHSVGLDLDSGLAKARVLYDEGRPLEEIITASFGPQSYSRALYNSAKVSQFMPTPSRRPIAWSHPVGRLVTQFKSFSLNQGRFMRDQVLGEAAQGNVKPLAILLGPYPVVGEIAQNTVASIKDRKRGDGDGLDRYLENITAMGAFGLTNSMILGARWGELDRTLLGPAYSDTEKFAEGLAQTVGGNGTRRLRSFVRYQPISQATIALMEAPGRMFPADVESYAEATARYRGDKAMKSNNGPAVSLESIRQMMREDSGL